MIADAQTINLAKGLFDKNYGAVQIKFHRDQSEVGKEFRFELVIHQGEYQDQMVRLSFDLGMPSNLAIDETGKTHFEEEVHSDALLQTYSNFYTMEERNCSLSFDFSSRQEEVLNYKKANMLYLNIKSLGGEDSCVPTESTIIVFSTEMTRKDKR